MEILVVHSDKKTGEMLRFVIENNFNTNVTFANYLQGAIDLLTVNSNYGLIIYDANTIKQDLFVKFKEAKKEIPCFYIGIDSTGNTLSAIDPIIAAAINPTKLVAELFTKLQEYVDHGFLKLEERGEALSIHDFCKIPPSMLIDESPLAIDLYLKLSDRKLIKIINQGDSFGEEDIKKYTIQKKQEYLYVRRDQSSALVNRFTAKLNSLFEETQNSSSELNLENAVNTHEVIHELSNKLGYTEEVKALINKNVELAVKFLEKIPSLKVLLARIEKEKDRYIGAHSTATAFVACAMAKNLDFSSEATFQKLTMASHLHDITLTNHELAMLRDLNELEAMKDQFTAEEVAAYEQHPILASKIAHQVAEHVPDVDNVILQHHEFGEEGSFPNKTSPMQINMLSALFIVAHEFVHCSIESTLENPETLKFLREKFSKGNFKKVFKAIDQAKK